MVESLFQRCSLLDGKLDPLLVDPLEESGSCGDALADEFGSTIQHSAHTVQEIPVPRLFETCPMALNSIVFAVPLDWGWGGVLLGLPKEPPMISL